MGQLRNYQHAYTAEANQQPSSPPPAQLFGRQEEDSEQGTRERGGGSEDRRQSPACGDLTKVEETSISGHHKQSAEEGRGPQRPRSGAGSSKEEGQWDEDRRREQVPYRGEEKRGRPRHDSCPNDGEGRPPDDSEEEDEQKIRFTTAIGLSRGEAELLRGPFGVVGGGQGRIHGRVDPRRSSLPRPSRIAPSWRSKRRFVSGPPSAEYCPIPPREGITRWQGITTMTGLWAQALPTARTAPGWPTRRAISAYVRVSPGGIRRISSSTFFSNFPTSRRTGMASRSAFPVRICARIRSKYG